ncbi:tRNA (uridine(34)/cytosine(34)/5-carboxymethylaminomethyluridine(34)-2'-O)-methyltransferase TrmL [Snodgrassella alvi]|uniref:tRNA (uridine(34)/cytosine(34)/5- carboxymethylaminomethyluridine(34)-2'-O)- methyltransferase TrmL n=1 Tax=Snodgrassella alvi TaxID=1196083 RepID=UPI0009FC7625|nr:tRNA (uridine(34)/cytosine(34)/5-carboxymethylaminomethyluridine(34)-2'-O)-methyltransferase TrmL [Snodgrassella alvi]ORF06851.1 tRNA (uridine(34)/cytosine(34)/5-carboxymethylaminomethyluridine(34)-2'-O)-methyltransferase TrmL [Snodgrassella alvi]ORF16263.1 tRNA (uridine(34)/cytosine(34)/5-carboxymethylaminomethyluridine(34)-2'-O)-methyltransferase TrmL [Snodgrassella alvi]ORF19588.1 tRNA (uridine(34)/cytosine(34)/5-carboxymethylaminomethyluridine(34)-2'-O)-methyltransferase TrmL [Snodgrassel
MSLHIALYQPQIPANTGNIARTCAGTHTSLHLIHPLGFSTDDKMLKRAGLDYWPHVDIHYHDSLEAFISMTETQTNAQVYLIETYGTRNYTQFDYSDRNQQIYFLFGRETTGLPQAFAQARAEQCLRIPQSEHIRSLNLSNAAAIVLYEALRQQAFPSLA